jgi:hypothetical protein
MTQGRTRFVGVSKWLSVLCVVSCLEISAPASAAQPEQSGGNAAPLLALVIGNSQYANLAPAQTCDASAHVMAAALGRAGFSVTIKSNVSNGEMGAAIANFGDAVTKAPAAHIVVYVCGYVVDFDGRAFLLPVSATLERESDTLAEGLAAKSLISTIARTNAHAGLLLLDAITKPGSPASAALDPLVGGSSSVGLGIISVHATSSQPQGSTPLAVTLSAALAQPEIEVGGLIATVAQGLSQFSGVAVAVAKPSAPAWLVGGPAVGPAQTPAAPASPPESAAPAPAAALTPVPAPTPAPPPPVPTPPAPPQPASKTGGPAAPDLANAPVTEERRIQAALQRLGYYDGKIDGIVGSEERAAIRRYQHEVGSEMTGKLTPAELSRLLAAGQ